MRNNITAVAVALTAVWSAPALAVTFEGNLPFKTMPLSGAPVTSAQAELAFVDLESCDDGFASVEVGETVDLLKGWSVEVPDGEWCKAVLVFDEDLILVSEEDGLVETWNMGDELVLTL